MFSHLDPGISMCLILVPLNLQLTSSIHELGIAISTGSTLDQREMVGLELIELADLASELTDEIVAINAMSVTTFSWLFWEVSERLHSSCRTLRRIADFSSPPS